MTKTGLRKILLCGVALSGWSGAAHAQATPAGTSINNQASVTYSVGGTSQSASSNTATFLVDKKVNVVVTGGNTTMTAVGTTDQVVAFQVTNLTNATQDFKLTPDQQSLSVPILGSDNFNVNNLRVFVDSNGNGTYDVGVDTATFIDELPADTSVTVFLVSDIPNAGGENTAIVSLSAQAEAGGAAGTQGAVLTATSLLTADSATTVDIVFADDAGLWDLARDGIGRAFDAYKISTAAVTMAKSATVISDPINLIVNPHAIPGAVIQYCLTINNAGPGTAAGLVIADNIPANTTFVTGSITVGGLGTGGVCVLNGTSEDDNATGADESDPYGGSFDGTTVRATMPSMAASTALAASFRVTVN